MKFSKKALLILLLTAFVIWGPACFKMALRQCLSLFVNRSLDGQFSVREIRLCQGKFVFLDVSFCKGEITQKLYEIQTPELELSFSWNSSLWRIEALVAMKEPQVMIGAPFSQIFPKKLLGNQSRVGLIHWQWEIVGASLSWQELGLQASFSAKKLGPEDLFSLELIRDSSRLEWNAVSQGVLLHFSNWDLKFLQPCLDFALLSERLDQGTFDGEIEIKDLSTASMHLKVRGDLAKTSLSSPLGSLSLAKATVEAELDMYLTDEPTFSLSWGRLHYSGGTWQKGRSKLEQLEGALSYCFDLGLQWQSAANASFDESIYPVNLSAKGFWPVSEAAWLDISLSSSEGTSSMHSDFRTWRVQIDEMRPFWGAFIQECLEEKGTMNEWNWSHGTASCLFEWKEESGFTVHTFRAEEIKVCHKLEVLKRLSCDALQMHFDAGTKLGNFSLEGLSGSWNIGDSYQIAALNWSANGSIDEEEIGDSKWSGQIISENLSFETHVEVVKGEPKHWTLHGSAAEYPFEIQIFSKEALWSIFFEGKENALPFGFGLKEVQGHLLIGPDHWNLEDSHVDFTFQEKAFRFEAFRLQKEKEKLFLDLRLTRGFWDIARVTASLKDGKLSIDPKKTEILGSLIEEESLVCELEEKTAFHLEIPWTSFFLLRELSCSMPPLSAPNLSGSIALDFLYEKGKTCQWTLKTEKAPWDQGQEPYVLQIQKYLDQWNLSLHIGKEACLSLFAGYEGGMWTIQKGDIHFARDSLLSCQFQGQCNSSGEAKLSLDHFAYRGRLEGIGEDPIDVSMQANGRAALNLSSFDYEVDFDLTEMFLKTQRFELKNQKTVHALFSQNHGIMLQGIDCQLRLDGELVADCAAKLFHYRPLPGAWLLHEARLHVLEKSFSILSPKFEPLNPHQDISLCADFRGSTDLSVFACSIKEGLIPFGSQLRHVQNLELYLDEQEIAADFFYVHQNRDLHCKILADRKENFQGSLILEDPDFFLQESEKPLQIDWQYQPLLGVSIQSIQGSFPGIDAAFYLQAIDDHSHLIGSARLDFKELALFVPPLINEFFMELDLGKGYVLKGKLEIDQKDLSQIFFSGLLKGKELELCGYIFRTMLAKVDVKPEEVKISDLNISDSSGLFKMDEMLMRGKKNELWTFSIPLLSFTEFRPSLLREVQGDEGSISPLVIRKMHLRNIQGVLEDKNTYAAEGELYFINSYKRGHSLLDLPSDVLGRIIGLDMELLIPVRGALRYSLKEGFFEIQSLEEAYSEGGRSQFFLANSKAPATLDLDGNLHIQVKMKQYVLFKLTEAFTIFIHGKLKNPQYHLQKKK